jgi:tRNA threonylcarbamoyladenosine modification (KEOPS) complex Cgi121 subunit
MDIGEKEVPIETSEKFNDESFVESELQDGLSDKDNQALSVEEDIKETK